MVQDLEKGWLQDWDPVLGGSTSASGERGGPPAIQTLLDAGATTGTVRPGIDANDVLMGLGGITMIAGEEDQRELATRLIDMLLHGITTTAANSRAAHPGDPPPAGHHD